MNKFFAKATGLIAITVSFWFGFGNLVWAQEQTFLEQHHFYDVLFRNEGEAVVDAKIIIVNNGQRPLTEFTFELPKSLPSDILIYQMVLPQECVRYDEESLLPQSVCLKYRDWNYLNIFGTVGGSEKTFYYKVKYTKQGNLYTLDLPVPIGVNKSGAIVISYVSNSYVDKSFGLYRFDFETIKVPSMIKKSRVSINAEEGFSLREKTEDTVTLTKIVLD